MTEAAGEGADTSWTTEPSWKPSLWHSSPRLERLLARSVLSGFRAPRRKAWIRGSRCLMTISPARESGTAELWVMAMPDGAAFDCKEMPEPHPALELAPSTTQSSTSPWAPRAAALHCTEWVDATSRAMLLPSRIVLRAHCRQTPNGDLLCCRGLTDHCLGLLRASQTPSVCC